MKKILLAIIFILLAGMCFLGYKWFALKQIHGNLVQETKGAMVISMMDIQNDLEAIDIDSNKNTINADIFFWSDLNTSVETVLTSTQILKNHYNHANHETDVLNSIWWTFGSLQSFIKQMMVFSQNNQPFAINNCDGAMINNLADIQNELQKYKQLLAYSRPKESTETEMMWLNRMESWNIAQAEKVYGCNMP